MSAMKNAPVNTTNQAASSEDEAIIPLWKLVLLQFSEHKMAMLGCAVLAFFILISLGAPWIADAIHQDPDTQNPLARYSAPGSVVIVESNDRVEQLENWSETHPNELAQTLSSLQINSPDELNTWVQKDFNDIKADLAVRPVPGAFKKLVLGFEKTHYLGTDELGRDVLVRLLYGTRVSIGVGVLVAIVSAFVGLIIGGFAGFYGGLIDVLLMRVTDSLLSLPTVPVLIVMAAVDFRKIPYLSQLVSESQQNLFKMVLILCLFSWMSVARLVRAQVLSLKEREFVLAAITFGSKDLQVLLRHLVPNVVGAMLVSVTLGIGNAILFESVLSFLGLGVQPPTPSWGNMLFNAQELVSEAPLLAIAPGLMILLTIVSFNYVGDGLQDAVDPKAIRR